MLRCADTSVYAGRPHPYSQHSSSLPPLWLPRVPTAPGLLSGEDRCEAIWALEVDLVVWGGKFGIWYPEWSRREGWAPGWGASSY